MSLLKLNLGACDHFLAGYLSVDICQPADVVTDLRNPWPWADNSVEAIYAHDVFEHLPDKIFTLNEAHRVLCPGGILDMGVPAIALADGRVNPGAFCDPTHTSYWHQDIQYYFFEEWNKGNQERQRFGPRYGITALFRPQVWMLKEYGQGAELRSKLLGVLEAVK